MCNIRTYIYNKSSYGECTFIKHMTLLIEYLDPKTPKHQKLKKIYIQGGARGLVRFFSNKFVPLCNYTHYILTLGVVPPPPNESFTPLIEL